MPLGSVPLGINAPEINVPGVNALRIKPPGMKLHESLWDETFPNLKSI